MSFFNYKDKEEVEYFSKLIYEITYIPVYFYNEDNEVDIQYPANFTVNPIHPEQKELFTQFDFQKDPYDVPVLRSTTFLENYISIRVGPQSPLNGTWIIGPSLYREAAEETLNGLISDLQIKVDKKTLYDYYHTIPIVSKRSLLHTALIATYLLYSKRLDLTEVIQLDSSLDFDGKPKENPDLHVAKNRQEISFHTTYETEQATFQCIKEGRKEELLSRINLPEMEGKLGILSKKSRLRSEKNLAISAITLATRSAMEGGVQPELAYTMSDLYIQELEELKEITAIQKLLQQAILDFTDRVIEGKHHTYSRPIVQCQSYIYKHLYEEISLADLAKVANMNPNYLSTTFKKEVGLSVTEYILRERIKEAKKLLSHSDYSISEIYTWLNFHDQSHFTKVFKKMTGVTPKKYRSGTNGTKGQGPRSSD
ncbi:helix-turn-helix domain-containing protein [Bacillus sp. AK128]